MKAITTFVLGMMMLLLIPAHALAQSPPPSPTYPPLPPPTIDVGPTDPDPGGKVTVTGANWCPNSTVDIYIDMVDDAHYLGTATVGPDGTFVKPVTIPPGTTPGPHEIIVVGLASDCQSPRTMSRTITIGGEEPGGSLPFTGANLAIGLMILVALVVVGIAATLAGRRRGAAGEE